jgi:hypothetical protein
MNTNAPAVQEISRKDIDRCNCPKCMGRVGTARVCFNSRKLASRSTGNVLAKTVGLLLLLAGFFSQGQARAGVTLPASRPTDPGQYDKVSVGYLTVFSSTEETLRRPLQNGQVLTREH